MARSDVSSVDRRKPDESMVVFDLDDTLYFERQFVISGFAAVEARLAALGFDAPDAATVFLRILDADGSGRVFNAALEHFDIEPTAELIGDLVHTYRHHPPTISPQPGIPELLVGLTAAGVRLGIITDGAVDIQHGKVAALGLTEHFEVILATDSLGPDRSGWKPSTRPFEFIEAATGLTGDALTYIGDNAAKDFVGAGALGWRCVRLRMAGQLRESVATPAGVLEVCDIDSLCGVLAPRQVPAARTATQATRII